jgi:dTDP-4-dehydrorhamnose reductase
LRLAVVGADGYLGRRLAAAQPDGRHQGRHDVELERPRLPRLDGHTHVVIAAAQPSIVACERDPAGTAAVNVTGAVELARQAVAAGLVPVGFSTDAVFDGKRGGYVPEDPPAPPHEYGRQKAAMEAQWPPEGLVVRLSKIYGGPATLVRMLAERLRGGELVRAARDHVQCPTHVSDAIAGIVELCEALTTGIAHVCAPPIAALAVAREVARAVGAPASLVEDVTLEDLHETVPRPRDTSLTCTPLRTPLRPVSEVLAGPEEGW